MIINEQAMNTIEKKNGWVLTRIDTFWNKIAYQKKVFHIRENENTFVEILAGFVGTGINADECAVVIATAECLDKLKSKLQSHGLHIASLIAEERFLPIAAESVLKKFMVDGLPNEELFFNCISGILAGMKNKGRHIRAYREMSSILFQQGNRVASSQLEQLWTRYKDKEPLSLFCAYPKMTSDECDSLNCIGIYNCKIVSVGDVASNIRYRECVES